MIITYLHGRVSQSATVLRTDSYRLVEVAEYVKLA